MRFILSVLFLIFVNVCFCNAELFRQEAAKVIFENPEYVKDVSILTYRRNRLSPYLTYGNGSSLQPWGNNVTMVVFGYNQKLGVELFNLEFKICDLVMVHWAKDWIKMYTDVPLQCPIPPNLYHFKDVEIPPKNFPIPLPPGDYSGTLTFMTTKEKEKILEIKMNLKFVAKMYK